MVYRKVHINAPDSYDTLYAGPTRRRHKDPWFLSSIAPGMSFATNDCDHHRIRRGGLNQFFSKQAVRELGPNIQAKTELLCRHVQQAQQTGHHLELHTLFVNFAVDTVSEYVFGHENGFNTLREPALSDKWKKGVNGIFEMLLILRHFPWLYKVSRVFPVPVTSWVFPTFAHINAIEQDIERQTKLIYGSDASSGPSIIKQIIENPKLPPVERSLDRLVDEAKFLLVAGTEAPSQVMAITMYHVLKNVDIYSSLRNELQMALPNADDMPSWSQLERLPRLSNVIREGLRISAVVTSRLPRIAPDEDLVFHGWRIPAKTVVSMSTHFILRGVETFPDPLAFRPERWEFPSVAMNRQFVPFSKGSQGCLGHNMAYCWLYIVLGTLLRRFDLALIDTDDTNVKVERDCFNGQTKPGKNSIKIIVRPQ